MSTFGERYLRPAVIQDDSPRMRVQLLALFERIASKDAQWTIRNVLREKTGGEVPWGTNGLDWQQFFKQGDLRDGLDVINATYLVLRAQPHTDRLPASLGGYKFPEATSASTCFSRDRSATRRRSRAFSRSRSFIFLA